MLCMKKLIILLLAAALLTAGTTPALANNEVWAGNEQLNILTGSSSFNEAEAAQTDDRWDLAGWAAEDFILLNKAGLIPQELITGNLSSGLTRLEFSQLIMPLYKLISGADDNSIELADLPYDDCDDLSAAQAYSLGFIATAGEGIFDPTGHISRQDFAVALVGMLQTAGIACTLSADDISALCGYEDFSEADSWAYKGLAKAVASEYISGVDENALLPHEDVTRSQAIAAAGRIYRSFFGDNGEFAAPQVKNPQTGSTATGVFAVNWDKTDGAEGYRVIVKDITYGCVADLKTSGTSVIIDTDYFVDGENYTVIIAAEYDNGLTCYSEPVTITYQKPYKTSSQSSAALAAKEARVFDGGARYTTAEEAAASMRTVTVPVWRLASDGTKYAAKQSLTVNKNLADDVIAIFTEIFNDDSKFPIKDLGCYNWRNTLGGAQSQHSFGTCIDINSNENFYVSAGGRALVGKLWEPYENPYSITPDGIVVKTFAKYGWLWGGNAWGEGYAKDYMHMTYLGG